ncbi:MAG: TolC family protein [Candidatus Omnitrophica bacterium]|nr:TolC family protein [Candidatus Omnitrophota bacterium]
MFKLIFFFIPFTWLLGTSSYLLAEEGTRPRPDPALTLGQTENTPLRLEDCYQMTLKRSEALGIKKEDIEEAKAQFFKASGIFFGDIEFTKNEFFQDGAGARGAGGQTTVQGSLTAEHDRETYFTVEQPLFQGMKSLGAVTGAGALKKQKDNEFIRLKQTLLEETASAFYDILRFKEEIIITEDIRSLFVERVNELNEREQIGRSRPSEVVNAVSRMKTLEGDLARARGNLQVSRHILGFLTGIEMDATRLSDENLENILRRDPNEFVTLAAKRPDVVAAENAVKVAWDAVIVAQSAFWPSVNLTANHYELREGFQSAINWDMLVELTVPIFQGGAIYGDFKEKISRWKKSKLELSRVRRKAVLEVKEAYELWHASHEEHKSFDEAVKSSNEDFRLQKEDYVRNLVSNLDVLDALERLNTNRKEANESFYNMKKDYWRLKVAAGEVK